MGNGVYHTADMSMLPWMVMAGASAAVNYFPPVPQPGDASYTPNPRHHLRVMFENDSAGTTDRNYTHGSRIDYVQNVGKSPYHAFGASLTQNIYTPETHATCAVKDEHPYAGYLALGVAHLYQGEQVGSAVEFQLGATGNASFARDSQEIVHEVGDMETWEGWGDQIPSELTFQLSARQDYRLEFLECCTAGGWQTDGIFYTREELGTVSIAGTVGVSIRLGRNLPPAMQVNGSAPANFAVGLLRKEAYRPEEISYFLVAGCSVNYIARDMFIDGGVFHDFNKTCSLQPWQVEGQLGIGVSHKNIDYYAGMFLRSRGYSTQDQNTWMGTFSINFNW